MVRIIANDNENFISLFAMVCYMDKYSYCGGTEMDTVITAQFPGNNPDMAVRFSGEMTCASALIYEKDSLCRSISVY